jgi:hypothetical protein
MGADKAVRLTVLLAREFSIADALQLSNILDTLKKPIIDNFHSPI